MSRQRQQRPSVRRNNPCPCGSGRKYKYCCLERDTRRRNAPRYPFRALAMVIWTLVTLAPALLWQPAPCSGDSICFDVSGVLYLALFFLWLVGLGMIWLVSWLFEIVLRTNRADGRAPAAPPPGH